MKKLTLLSLMVCCLAAMSFISCDNNDDNNTALSKDEKAQCLAAVKGDYTGKMVYADIDAKTLQTVNDTVDISWSILTDSTMIIKHFPTKALTVNITDNTLSSALTTAASVDMTCQISFVKTSPVTFLINPITPSYNLTYGGIIHQVQIPFYTNNGYTFGAYNATKGLLQMQIVEGGIYVDGKATTFLKAATPFLLYATKK